MPRRARTNKRRDTLTLERDLLLTIGPRPGQPLPEGDEWEVLRACWFAHREHLIGDDPPERLWGYRAFELNDPAENELVPADEAA